jgi:hypothetical protein
MASRCQSPPAGEVTFRRNACALAIRNGVFVAEPREERAGGRVGSMMKTAGDRTLDDRPAPPRRESARISGGRMRGCGASIIGYQAGQLSTCTEVEELGCYAVTSLAASPPITTLPAGVSTR